MKAHDVSTKAYHHALTARMNQKYHAHLESRFASLDRVSQLLTIALLLAVAIAFAAGGESLALLLAYVALIHTVVVLGWSPSSRAQHHANLRADWISIRIDAQALRRHAKTLEGDERAPQEMMRVLDDLDAREGSISVREGPARRRLLDRCFNDVLTEEGHTVEDSPQGFFDRFIAKLAQ